MLEWKEEFRIGIDAIDHEHRQLIDLINKTLFLIEAENQTGQNKEEILNHLGEIHAVTSAHFALEEQEMAQINYPEFAPHKTDHEALLDSLLDIMDEATPEDSTLLLRLEERLTSWFSNHFRTFDAAFHRFGSVTN